MEMITVTAKTLDEAITKALIQLGTTSDNLEYTVIEKGSAGFLGFIGKKDVVIQAKKKKENDLDDIFSLDEKKIEPVKPAREPRKEKPKQELRQEKPCVKAETKPEVKAPKAETKMPKAEQPKETPVVEAAKEPEKKADAPKKVINVEACEKAAVDFLKQVFGAMNMEVTIETSYDASERELAVNMTGDDMGILIGKRGQTLDSLQYLVSLVVNKESDGYLRVKLDTENYRSRRKETLETLARNIAYKVKRTRRSVSLEPMNPYERRIIHAALQNDKYVVTRSEGEDPFRHVVISLKREAREGREYRGGRNRENREGGRGPREKKENSSADRADNADNQQA